MALDDILLDELTENNIRIIVQKIYQATFERDTSARWSKSVTPKIAINNLTGVYDLIRRAIQNYESRANTPTVDKVTFTEEDPDKILTSEVITASCLKRDPGAFSQGAPFEGKVKNLRPRLWEERDDPENPGYKLASIGYFYDNLVRLTCWARTNKGANRRSDWLENLMEEYSWWFKAEGVDRTLFMGRDKDIVKVVDNNKWYGRPLDYFVRTEKISILSEKKIEQILINLTLSDQ